MPPETNAAMVKTLTLDGYLLAGIALAALLVRLLLWPRRATPGQPLPLPAVAAILLAAVAAPATWPLVTAAWGGLGPLRQADLLAIGHFALVWYVILLQMLVFVGWWRGWRWVRGFWLRLVHLALMAVITGQAAYSTADQIAYSNAPEIPGNDIWIECPFTIWERQLRGGDLANIDGSWPVARLANRFLYARVPTLPVLVGYLIFLVGVFISWVFFRPLIGPEDAGTSVQDTPTNPGGPA